MSKHQTRSQRKASQIVARINEARALPYAKATAGRSIERLQTLLRAAAAKGLAGRVGGIHPDFFWD